MDAYNEKGYEFMTTLQISKKPLQQLIRNLFSM